LSCAGIAGQKRQAPEDSDSTLLDVWMRDSGFPALDFEESNNLCIIPAKYVPGAGVNDEKSDLILYRRPIVRTQFRTLKTDVVEKGSICWVLGPPGSGKSCTAFAFALSLDRSKFVITWIHLSRDLFPVIIHFVEQDKCVMRMGTNDHQHLLKILDQQEVEGKTHILFLDGYVDDVDGHPVFMKACNSWVALKRNFRRLAIISSMQSRGKNREGDDVAHGVFEFPVSSWVRREYCDAVAIPRFFEHVKPYLDAHYLPEDIELEDSSKIKLVDGSPADLVLSKEYFAGASCRHMFSRYSVEVTKSISNAVDSANSFVSIQKADMGQRSKNAVNRLFACYFDATGRRTSSCIVSKYAVSELAIRLGPDGIEALRNALPDLNPSMDGWILEYQFFARLRHGGVSVKARADASSAIGVWKASTIESVDTSNKNVEVSDLSKTWMKPLRWNQGGWDAVCVETEQTHVKVKFVQVTRATSHKLKLQYFRSFLNKLQHQGKPLNPDLVEIYFVTTEESVPSFSVGDVVSAGCLSKWTGWTKGQEQGQCKICSMLGR